MFGWMKKKNYLITYDIIKAYTITRNCRATIGAKNPSQAYEKLSEQHHPWVVDVRDIAEID